jgi:hypothetical protein
MALASSAIPFGLREVEITPINDDGTEGDKVKLPASRTFSFSETEEFEELRGDDGIVAVRGSGAQVEWDLEGGGISLEAWKVLSGGNLDSSGTTPEEIKTFSKKDTDSRPYFKVRGRAISDSGGDFVCELFKCRATGDLTGEMSDGEFWLTGASGQAMGRDADRVVYEFRHRETAAAFDSGGS